MPRTWATASAVDTVKRSSDVTAMGLRNIKRTRYAITAESASIAKDNSMQHDARMREAARAIFNAVYPLRNGRRSRSSRRKDSGRSIIGMRSRPHRVPGSICSPMPTVSSPCSDVAAQGRKYGVERWCRATTITRWHEPSLAKLDGSGPDPAKTLWDTGEKWRRSVRAFGSGRCLLLRLKRRRCRCASVRNRIALPVRWLVE